MSARLTGLTEGQPVPYGGDRVALVSADLAAAFRDGDRLVVVHETGDLLHVPVAHHRVADGAVSAAVDAFQQLASCSDEQISRFYEHFAARLADAAVAIQLDEANAADVASAVERGRSTTRLALTASMRDGMIAGLLSWATSPIRREQRVDSVDHGAWSVETWRAPLGVVGFVFEGRPNVFADAAGVLRTGNTAVFRIGRDALGTARAIMALCVEPALIASGLPPGAIQLVDSEAHAAGWALFADRRLGLAVARGSGPAVAQLGAVARQHGVPASLHGTGGAWLVVDAGVDPAAVSEVVRHSLDRKVCNTLNVCCVVAGSGLGVAVRAGAASAAADRSAAAIVHQAAPDDDLGHEFEWENDPEFWLCEVDSVDHAVELFNRRSPHFVASLLSPNPVTHDTFYRSIDSPFVGDGFTRWVDGQFALDKPELGLSNWQAGRILARSGILSGDSVHTLRLRAHVRDPGLRR